MLQNIKKNKIKILLLVVLCFVLILVNLLNLKMAHSTFENYYKFRNCVELIEKKEDYAICKIFSGQIIKIVKINNKWYLEGDGPGVY